MRRMPAILLGLLVAEGLCGSQGLCRSLEIDSFDADIRVNRDASIEVTETIRPRFQGEWNGIYRTIPVEYKTPQGFRYKLWLDLVSITDETGIQLRYKPSRERHYLQVQIWVPGARDAVRTVVIRYRVSNALRFFPEHDELYWNVTGDEWEVGINDARARVVLPEGVDGIRANAFTGGYGSREQAASVDAGQREVVVRTARVLNLREGLTVAVAWNPGVVHRPGFAGQAFLFLRSNWVFIFPVLAFLIMFLLWRNRGRDPRRRPIATQYEPPDSLTPAEVGTLIDNYPGMRDVTATLVDLAVRGYLRIDESGKEELSGLRSADDYSFVLRKEKSEWDDLRPHERAFLGAVFHGTKDEKVALGDLENKFYEDLPGIRDRIFTQLIARQYYRQRPDKVKRSYLIAAVVVGVLLVFLLGVLGYLAISPFGTVLTGVLCAGVVGFWGSLMPARTTIGTRALEKVLGFQEFMKRVEADRLERIVRTPEMFEKYLPFAMALGVEKNWARAFRDIYRQQPEWYAGGHFDAFHSAMLASSLSRMTGKAGAAMASSPRSSGGSGFGRGGFGGGGFSGGGFGGGGGRGF